VSPPEPPEFSVDLPLQPGWIGSLKSVHLGVFGVDTMAHALALLSLIVAYLCAASFLAEGLHWTWAVGVVFLLFLALRWAIDHRVEASPRMELRCTLGRLELWDGHGERVWSAPLESITCVAERSCLRISAGREWVLDTTLAPPVLAWVEGQVAQARDHHGSPDQVPAALRHAVRRHERTRDQRER